ncbi:sugar ABC transporter permease [Paenibacillus swuensis]|uniref:Sugar ABC transporter permease n=2 Tax=Paenibacillus swuensis TaxID=1178515 RepID=A0A172TNU8_9BACL|nr:sugar ABC transporter permease [Paenibacillus swuensis]
MSGWILNSFFMLFSVACIIPILLVLSISFSDEETVAVNGYSLFPEKFSAYAYKFVLADYQTILQAYGVTVFVTVVGTLLGTLITAFYGYVLSRRDFKYRNVFAFIVFFTMLFNGGLVPWYITWTKLMHLNNTIWVLILPSALNAFYVIVMKSFFTSNIPDSLVESAKIDGAGEFRIFFSIVVHLAKPGLATIGLFLAIGYWNDWYNALIFVNDRSLMPVQYLLYQVQAKLDFLNSTQNLAQYKNELTQMVPSESARMALAMITIGPIVFAYPFFQRFFVKGLTVGAVKE